MKTLVPAATLAVMLAGPAAADEIREYVMHGDAEAGPARKYVVVTRHPKRRITVIEGAPRWIGYRYTSVNRRHEPSRIAPEFEIIE